MRRIALLGWVLLGVCATVPFAMAQTQPGPPADQTAAAAKVPSGVSVGPVPQPVAQRPRGPVRVSDGVLTRNRISVVSPEYPVLATLKRLSGQVNLNIVISKTGTVENLKVTGSTNPIFNQASIDAVRQWRYRPFLLNGEPTEVESSVTINFR